MKTTKIIFPFLKETPNHSILRNIMLTYKIKYFYILSLHPKYKHHVFAKLPQNHQVIKTHIIVPKKTKKKFILNNLIIRYPNENTYWPFVYYKINI